MQYDYMEDCIHLHACRLLAKRYRDAGSKFVARFCNEDCTAYQRMMHVDPDDGWYVPLYVIENGDCCFDEYEDDDSGYAVSKANMRYKEKKNSDKSSKKQGLKATKTSMKSKPSPKKRATAPKKVDAHKTEYKKKAATPYRCINADYLASVDACTKVFGGEK